MGGEVHTVPSTLKKVEGNSFPIVVVEVVNTPRGNVNPHHPMLNGNRLRLILAAAKNSHTSPNPHIMVAANHPTTYNISPGLDVPDCSVPVIGKSVEATFPNCMMAKPPWPSGPRGRKTETITSRGGSLWIVRRWK